MFHWLISIILGHASWQLLKMYHFQVSIPMVFLFANDGKTLLKAMAAAESRLAVTISDSLPSSSKLYYRMGTGFVFNITLGVAHAVFITEREL